MSEALFDLSGKTALVSGASRGIGEAIARLLAAHGARVVCTSRRREGCEAVAESIRADGLAPDILVNNAAANPYFGPMLDQDLASFEKTVEVNLRGYFWSSVQAARRMRTRGGGCIVNIASVNARRSAPGQGVYSMTKAGIVNLTEGFAKELAADGIRVNAVLPGLTDTKFASALTSNPKILGMMMQLTPLNRVAQPAEIAPAVLFLCSAASSYVTGSVITADGGYLA